MMIMKETSDEPLVVAAHFTPFVTSSYLPGRRPVVGRAAAYVRPERPPSGPVAPRLA